MTHHACVGQHSGQGHLDEETRTKIFQSSRPQSNRDKTDRYRQHQNHKVLRLLLQPGDY